MYNTFEGLEEISEDVSNNTKAKREVKPLPIFIPKVSNLRPLSQLLKEVINAEFELRIITSVFFDISQAFDKI